MTHAFRIDKADAPIRGTLAFVEADHAFDFRLAEAELPQNMGTKGSTSLLVGSLQIEIDIETGRLMFVWGYHPKATWRQGQVNVSDIYPGEITLVEPNLEVGISEPFVELGEWPTIYDPDSGWVFLGADPEAEPVEAIEFAQNTVAGLSRDNITALWLKPSFE